MNGSVHSSAKFEKIKLKRGPAGLGFNIIGGVDQQYVVNDSGIFVSKIKADGAAAQDGRLEEGDKILMINGIRLENLMHNAVVELFRTAGEDVELHVLKKPTRHMNGLTDSQPEHQSSLSSYLGMLTLLAGTVALLAIIYRRCN